MYSHKGPAILAAVGIVSATLILSSVLAQPSRTGTDDIYPDAGMTPGLLLAETSEDPAHTICNPNWSTKTIRPPSSYTTQLKKKQMIDYGDTVPDPNATCMLHSNNTKCYEEDHLCSLEIGGDPTNPTNLWPEPYHTTLADGGAKKKDLLENYLHSQICKGVITPQDACTIVSKDWYLAYEEMTGKIDPNTVAPSSSDE